MTTRLIAMLTILGAALPAYAGRECLVQVNGASREHGGSITQVARAGACRFDVSVCSRAWALGCGDGAPATVTVHTRPTLAGVVTPDPLDTGTRCRSVGFLLVEAARHRAVRRRVRVVAQDSAGHRDRDAVVLRCQPEVPSEPPPACVATGCSHTQCEPTPVADACVWEPAAACYRQATCGVREDGTCGWTPTTELTDCLNDPAAPCAAVDGLVDRARQEVVDAELTPPDVAIPTWGDAVDDIAAALEALGVPWRTTWRDQTLHDVFPGDLDVDRARRGFVNGMTRLIDDLTAVACEAAGE